MQLPVDVLLIVEIDVISFIIIGILFVCSLRIGKSKAYYSKIHFLVSALFLCITDILAMILYTTASDAFFFVQGLLAIGLMLVPTTYAEFVLQELGYDLRIKWLKYLLLLGPTLLTAILYYTLPLYTSISDGGYYSEPIYIVVANATRVIQFVYEAIALIAAFIAFFKERKADPDKYEKSKFILIFTVIFITLVVAEHLIFDDNYITYCPVIAMGLIYLISSVNTFDLKKAALVEADLKTASTIQSNALPKVFPPFEDHPEVELFAKMVPAKEVGGDFFDCFEIDETHVAFLMADVSGKGIPAALFMMRAKTSIRDMAGLYNRTDVILSKVNESLMQTKNDAMFVTVWLGIYDTVSREIEYTNAGHCSPLISTEGSDFSKLADRHGPALAIKKGVTYKCSTMKLPEGSEIFLYTDGLTEAHNISEKMYGTERAIALLDKMKYNNTSEVLDSFTSDVNKFAAGREQFDDITLMLVRMI